MTLVKCNRPANEPAILIPSLIDNFFGRDMEELLGLGNMVSRINTNPGVNIKETPGSYLIEVAAPGLKKENFSLEMEKNVLTVSAEVEKREEETKSEGKFTRREYNYHSFSRSFTLPQSAEGEKISAVYTDGVLSVSIPKKEEQNEKVSRKIEVK